MIFKPKHILVALLVSTLGQGNSNQPFVIKGHENKENTQALNLHVIRPMVNKSIKSTLIEYIGKDIFKLDNAFDVKITEVRNRISNTSAMYIVKAEYNLFMNDAKYSIERKERYFLVKLSSNISKNTKLHLGMVENLKDYTLYDIKNYSSMSFIHPRLFKDKNLCSHEFLQKSDKDILWNNPDDVLWIEYKDNKCSYGILDYELIKVSKKAS